MNEWKIQNSMIARKSLKIPKVQLESVLTPSDRCFSAISWDENKMFLVRWYWYILWTSSTCSDEFLCVCHSNSSQQV